LAEPDSDLFVTDLKQRLEQEKFPTANLPVDFSQTVYTPQPISTLTSPQKSPKIIPAANEPGKPPTIENPLPKVDNKNPETSKSTSTPPVRTATKKVSTSHTSQVKTTSRKKDSEPITATPLSHFLTSTNQFPSSQPYTTSTGSSDPSLWTSSLSQQIDKGEYFGNPSKSPSTLSSSSTTLPRRPTRASKRFVEEQAEKSRVFQQELSETITSTISDTYKQASSKGSASKPVTASSSSSARKPSQSYTDNQDQPWETDTYPLYTYNSDRGSNNSYHSNDNSSDDDMTSNQHIMTYLRQNLGGTTMRVEPFYGDGLQDPMKWMEDFEKAARINDWENNRKITLLKAHLRDDAEEWCEAQTDITTWDEWKTAFMAFFCTFRWINKWHRELEELKQGKDESIDVYYAAYRRLIRKIDKIEKVLDKDKLRYFLQGLRTELALY
jgi:hypothetical protein